MTPTGSAAAARRLARAVTEVCAPAVLLSLLLVGVALGEGGWPAGVLPAVVCLVFVTGGPFAALEVLSRSGRISDHHVGNRAQRRPVFAGALVSVLAGTGLLALLGAGPQLAAVLWATLFGLVLVGAVNLGWKLSAHAAVATFVVLAVVRFAGDGWLPLLLLVPLVCWSRVELGDHTTAQVVAGAAAGALTAGVLALLLGAQRV